MKITLTRNLNVNDVIYRNFSTKKNPQTRAVAEDRFPSSDGTTPVASWTGEAVLSCQSPPSNHCTWATCIWHFDRASTPRLADQQSNVSYSLCTPRVWIWSYGQGKVRSIWFPIIRPNFFILFRIFKKLINNFIYGFHLFFNQLFGTKQSSWHVL